MSASQISVGITILFLTVILLTALFCGLARKRRKLVPALILTAAAPVAALLAALICRLTVKSTGETLFRFVYAELDSDITMWLKLMPSGEAGLKVGIGVLAAFVLFLPVFILTYILCRVLVGVLVRVIFGKKEKNNHLSGFLVGLGNGAILGMILLIPLCCLVSTTSGAGQAFFDTGAGDTAVLRESLSSSDIDTVQSFSTALSGNGMVKVVDAVVGKPAAAVIGSMKVDVPDNTEKVNEVGKQQLMIVDRAPTAARVLNGSPIPVLFATDKADAVKPDTFRLNLAEELKGLARAAGCVMVVIDRVDEFNQTHVLTADMKAAIDNALNALFDSEWLTQLAAELLNVVTSEWTDGKGVLDLPYPDLNELLEPLVQSAMQVLRSETAETLKADVMTVKDVLFLLSDAVPDLDGQDYSAMLRKVWEEGLYGKVQAVIAENPHMEMMNDALDDFGYRAVSYAIGRSGLVNGEYRELLEELAAALEKLLSKTPAEREMEVRKAVQIAFDRYNIRIPDELAVSMAEKVFAEYGADGHITADELYDFLMSQYSTIAEGLAAA